MAVASSAPELAVSLIALFKPGAHESIGMGTIVGSALFNLLFVVGVSAIVARETKLIWQSVVRDVLFYLVVIALLLVAFWDGRIDLFEALTFVFLYMIYVFLAVYWNRILPEPNLFYNLEGKMVLGWRKMWIVLKEVKDEELEQKKKHLPGERLLNKILGFMFISREKYLWCFMLSIVFIVGLSWQIVDSAVWFAAALGIPEVIVALTILAIGVSIPDFLTSFLVAREGRGNMAINNAIGSNIFDVLFGLGLPWLIWIAWKGSDVVLNREGLLSSVQFLFYFVILFFLVTVLQRWKVDYRAGVVLVFCYIGYLVYEVGKVLSVGS